VALAAVAVTVVCLMFFVFQVGDKSMTRGEADRIEATLRGQGHSRASEETNYMNGIYELMAYDENYRTYLETMGVPWFVIPIILASKETITYTDLGDAAIVVTETSMRTRHMNITFGEEFSMELPKGMGTMWNICTREGLNVMMCHSEERDKGWELTSKMVFTKNGAINERTNIKGNISTKKYYKREGILESSSSDVEEAAEMEGSWEDSLEFGDDENW